MEDERTIEVCDPSVWREVEIEAEPAAVWETIATESGRELWLEPGAGEIEVVESEPPARLVWFWGPEDRPARRVEFLVVAIPSGSRVIVIESEPSLPLTMLARACRAAIALA